MRVLRSPILATAAIAVLLSVGITVPAYAAEATQSPPPVAVGDIEIQLWMAANPSEAVTIVSVAIPETVELPATVRLPLIEGTQVDWAGEISGGDPSTDPPRKFKIVDGPKGGRYAEFTVEQYRLAQIDLSPTPHVEQGDQVSASFAYVEPIGGSGVAFSVRLPAVASDVKITPEPSGKPRTNDIGESLHTLTPMTLEAGEKISVDVSYVVDLGKLDGDSNSDTFGVIIGVLAAMAVVMLVAVVVLMGRQNRRTAETDSSDEDD